MRTLIVLLALAINVFVFTPLTFAQQWRSLPLIKDGKVDPSWKQMGYGGFSVHDGALRTDCDEKGMGLLLYTKEKLGNCQIRVVYKSEQARSNAGVFVRIDEGIMKRLDENAPAIERLDNGDLTEKSFATLMRASEEELGPWYAVHHGFEVQICDQGGEFNRTGAVYSLAKAKPVAPHDPNAWRTMIITLDGQRIDVEVDGKQISTFDPTSSDVPSERVWHEPKREPERPTVGYIGLQNHDPGDVVYFKEVSVRPLNQ